MNIFQKSWRLIRQNPTKVVLALGILLAFANAAVLGLRFQRKRTSRALTQQLEPIEIDLEELRQAEREGFKKLQVEVDTAEARLASLESSFPELGAPYNIFRRGFELASASSVEVTSVQRGSTVVEDTVLGPLITTTFNLESVGDLVPCLGLLSLLEHDGLHTLALEDIHIEPAQSVCSFDVVIISSKLVDSP